MPSNLTEQTITEAVQRSFDGADDARFRELLTAAVGHLHDLAREVRLTTGEMLLAGDFIMRLGQFSGPRRQEVLLMFDILGLSVLVDKINQTEASSATDSSVLGPFYLEQRPRAKNGDDISGGLTGTPMFVAGRVQDEDGRPIRDAKVDTWQSDGQGLYDIQQSEKLHNEPAMRAVLTTDDAGKFSYRTIAPNSYPVATDGPCGEIMRAANRPVMRPQHVHYRICSDNYQPLITQLYLRDDPYLETDSIFAAQDSLLADFVRHEAGTAPDGSTLSEPFVTLDWTFTLAAEAR